MSDRPDPDLEFDLEPERYELRSPDPSSTSTLDRREFLRVAGRRPARPLPAEPRCPAPGIADGRRRSRRGPAGPAQIGAWLHIGEDGRVTAYTGKVEVGQNIRTSLTQAVAEELRCPLESGPAGHGRHGPGPVRHGDLRQPHHADDGRRSSAGRPPRRGTAPGPGGRAMERRPRLARAVATARSSHAGDGQVGRLRRADPGPEARRRRSATRPPTTPPADVDGRRPVGPEGRRPRLRDRASTGTRPTSSGPGCSRQGAPAARLRGHARLARHVRGGGHARRDVVRDGDFVGVAAPTSAAAARALAALKAEWKPTPAGPARPTRTSRRTSRRIPSADGRGPGDRSADESGSVEDGLAASADQGRGDLHGRLHRPRPAGAARGGGRVGRRAS